MDLETYITHNIVSAGKSDFSLRCRIELDTGIVVCSIHPEGQDGETKTFRVAAGSLVPVE